MEVVLYFEGGTPEITETLCCVPSANGKRTSVSLVSPTLEEVTDLICSLDGICRLTHVMIRQRTATQWQPFAGEQNGVLLSRMPLPSGISIATSQATIRSEDDPAGVVRECFGLHGRLTQKEFACAAA